MSNGTSTALSPGGQSRGIREGIKGVRLTVSSVLRNFEKVSHIFLVVNCHRQNQNKNVFFCSELECIFSSSISRSLFWHSH